MRSLFPKAFLAAWIAAGVLWAGTLHAQVTGFVQVNLVSDIPGLATITDSNLVNPWGVSHSTTSPFWSSNQGTSTATLYMGRHSCWRRGRSALGRVSRTHRLSTTVRNCTRDEGGPFEAGSQVQVSSHRKLLSSRAMVVSVAETSGSDPGRQG